MGSRRSEMSREHDAVKRGLLEFDHSNSDYRLYSSLSTASNLPSRFLLSYPSHSSTEAASPMSDTNVN